jgi:hypothetical protein
VRPLRPGSVGSSYRRREARPVTRIWREKGRCEHVNHRYCEAGELAKVREATGWNVEGDCKDGVYQDCWNGGNSIFSKF